MNDNQPHSSPNPTLRPKPIPYTSFCQNIPRICSVVFDFPAEVCHGHPHKLKIFHCNVSPDFFCDVAVGQNFASIFHKKFQKFVFCGSQMNFTTVHSYQPFFKINHKTVGFKNLTFPSIPAFFFSKPHEFAPQVHPVGKVLSHNHLHRRPEHR